MQRCGQVYSFQMSGIAITVKNKYSMFLLYKSTSRASQGQHANMQYTIKDNYKIHSYSNHSNNSNVSLVHAIHLTIYAACVSYMATLLAS